MLETIFNSIGGNVVNTIAEKAGVSVDQAKEMLPIAQETVENGFMEQVTNGNVSGITSLFNSSEANFEENSIFSGIKTALVSNIMSKMGLPESVAGIAAKSCIGNVISELSGITKDESGSVTEQGVLAKFSVVSTPIVENLTSMVKNETSGVTEAVAEIVTPTTTVNEVGTHTAETVATVAKDKLNNITGGAF